MHTEEAMDTLFLFRDSMMLDVEPSSSQADERKPFRAPDLSAREREIVHEINLLRADPIAYAELLIRRRKHFYLTRRLGARRSSAAESVAERRKKSRVGSHRILAKEQADEGDQVEGRTSFGIS